jgi:hypothetical protein
MPEMKDLNAAAIRVDTVVDVQRGMEQPPDVRMPFNHSSEIRKDLQRIEVVEKCVSELFGRAWMLLPRPIEYLFQIG